MVAEDKMPWYRKKNLRILYVYLFLCCMGVEMTSGFDSQLINVLQFSPPFNEYFGNGYKNPLTNQVGIEPSLLGFMNACYQLGSIFGVPIAPWVNKTYGRRWAIMIGSIVMVVGALLQGFAQHGKHLLCFLCYFHRQSLSLYLNGIFVRGSNADPVEQSPCTSSPACSSASVSFSASSPPRP
jgi:MFS family permease